MYIYILTPIIAFIFAQGLKVIIKSFKKKIVWRDIFAYSDMPSGHTSVVTAITAIIGLTLGVDSPMFAIAFVFAMIVMVDAIGLRNYLGQHGKTLNILVKDLKEDDFLDNSYPKLLEKIGHTPLQVVAGATIGILTSIASWLLFA
jgi:acid phosphatase family membrane protein YuiD